MDTRQVVAEFLQRLADGDPKQVAELYGEEVDWKLDWPPGDYEATVPWIRQRSTRAGVAEHFRLIAEYHVPEESSAAVHAILIDGNDAVILGELRNTARPTGQRYVAAFALHLTVVDGRITRHHVYEDSLSVARAFNV